MSRGLTGIIQPGGRQPTARQAHAPSDMGGVAPPCYNQLTQDIRAAWIRSFGYVDEYPHYAIVYPWILERLGRLKTGLRLLDLGAGVNPLPLLLAEAGNWVDCVDSSNIVRTLPATESWNGWGFFDYASLHPNLRSIQCSAEDFVSPGVLYEAIYSAGMVAHLPARARAQVFGNCSRMLSPGGALLLYVDLVPRTELIWNRCAGAEVEGQEVHGSKSTVLQELAAAGFDVNGVDIVRDVSATRTDILMIDCVATSGALVPL